MKWRLSTLLLSTTSLITIKVTLNTQGQITSAWVYIANAKTGQVYYSDTISLSTPIPDSQVFFAVEDPVYYYPPYLYLYPLPIIPSSNYIFVNTFNEVTYWGLPLCPDGVEFIMGLPYALAYVTPTFGLEYIGGIAVGTQGVQYYW